MKARMHKLILVMAVLLAFSINGIMAQESTLVQVKTFDQGLKMVPDLELSFDNQIFFITGSDGTTIIEIPNTLLPPKVIFIADTLLEAETWNYSRGVLEIVIRVKTFEIYNFTVLDSSGILQRNLIVRLNSDDPKVATVNSEGIVQFPVPLDLDLNRPGVFMIQDYRITNVKLSGNTGIITVELIPVRIEEPVSQEEISQISINIDYLDSIHSLTAFYAFIRGMDMTALDEEQKLKIDNKFRALMLEFSDSLSQSSALIDRISDTSLVKDDILFLTEQALKESQLIRDTRREFNAKVELINDKLVLGGGNLNDAERERLLIDLTKLEDLLRENELLFAESQAEFKSTLNQLKNKLLNIKELEDLLSASEIQRLAEQKEFRKQLFIAVGIGLGLLILTVLLVYFVQKFNRQRKALAVANAEIKRINDNLENLVAIKTASLTRVNKELDTFIYRSSHDLRRPLTSIIGLANVAELTMDKESYKLFELTKKTALDMDKLLQKLLMVNHINYPADFSEVHFPKLVGEISSEFKEIIEKNEITISYEISEDIHYSSYPMLLEIIIKTILENALFYSTFCLDKKPKVKIVVRREDSNLYIMIHDNGEGISKEVRNKVWNMFFVGNEKSHGNGLGLYIAHRAVKILKGGISFATKIGEGTKFEVQLPFENNISKRRKKEDTTRKEEGLQPA